MKMLQRSEKSEVWDEIIYIYYDSLFKHSLFKSNLVFLVLT